MLVQPRGHFGESVENGFLCLITVAFVGEHDEAHGAAVPGDGLVEAFALHGEGAGVVVLGAVEEEDGGFDFVGVGEGAHAEVGLGRLPEGARLGLETEGREGAVVGSGAGDAGAEEIGVCEKVGSHEGAVGMPAHGDASALRHAQLHDLLDSGGGAGD